MYDILMLALRVRYLTGFEVHLCKKKERRLVDVFAGGRGLL